MPGSSQEKDVLLAWFSPQSWIWRQYIILEYGKFLLYYMTVHPGK